MATACSWGEDLLCKSGRHIICIIYSVNTGEGDFWVALSRFSKIPVLAHTSCVLSLQTGNEFLFAFLKQSVHVLSCVRPVAPIFQHDLFFFHCLGATLAEQMNQTMLLNQSRANTISKYYPIGWF